MKAKTITILMTLAVLSGTVRADRSLENAEISQILQTLTSRPAKAWISSGTISATHDRYRAPKTTNSTEITSSINEAVREHQQETSNSELSADILKMKLDAIPFNVRYRLSNEYTMSSNETVAYDGERFHWDIDVSSRTDSVRPGPELAANQMTREFKMQYNRRRTFAWNGQEYTLQSRSNNSAFVDAGRKLPHVVNGPLTAGFIPWGYGQYTYANLASLKSSAVEVQLNGQTQIHLTLDKSDGSRLSFVLDAGNSYAVISHSTEGLARTVSRQYGGYRAVGDRLVPSTVVIEQYDAATNRLLARDSWYITSVSTAAPSLAAFSVAYSEGARVEYASPVVNQTAVYQYSARLDTELLLAERLSFAAPENTRARNCATAALRCAGLRLGRNVDDAELAQLVDRTNGRTSLSAMKDFVHRQGLYCRAVTTDIETLKGLTDCQVILHIPHKNHFVLLGDIDNESIWTIDLAGRRFCRRADVGFFGMDWTQGTALLVSNSPVSGAFDDIADGSLDAITGDAGWTCTELLQYEYTEYCDIVAGFCNAWYVYQPERWGCEQAESGMCIPSDMLYEAACPCVSDLYDPFACEVTGDWDLYYMEACS